MQERGARIVDVKRSQLAAGDVMVVPANNTNVRGLPLGATGQARKPVELRGLAVVRPAVFAEPAGRVIELVELQGCSTLATVSRPLGAGFYADMRNRVLPFTLGPVPPEQYYLIRLDRPLGPADWAPAPAR
jgi:hypothetical protein